MLSNVTAADHIWHFRASSIASVTEEPNFLFDLNLIHLNLDSHMWPVVTVLDNTDLSPLIIWMVKARFLCKGSDKPKEKTCRRGIVQEWTKIAHIYSHSTN